MNIAIILSGGTGSRIGSELPKQFLKIGMKSVIEYSVEAFEDHKDVYGIIIVSNPGYIQMTKDIIGKKGYKKVIKIIEGGKTRQESSFIGVSSVGVDIKNVLIHDAARPFVSAALIDRLIRGLSIHKAVVPVVSSPDTLVEVNRNGKIVNIPDRSIMQRVQTPQAFDLNLIKSAHIYSRDSGFAASDDSSMVLISGLSEVFVVDGNIDNIKITYPSDVSFAETKIMR